MTHENPAEREVMFKVRNPEFIPSPRYYDARFFALEKERFWPYVWQMACRLEQIPNVGDFTEYTILDRSVIVIRTQSGIKAFQNACRHRGVKLASGHGNFAKRGFVCPFHGWRYDIDGRSCFVFGRQIFNEQVLKQSDIDLTPVRAELWAGCAFINFDNAAATLLESLGPVAERLNARNVDQLRMEWWYSTVLPTNWKLAMEAFQEGYHVMRTHPQLHALTPSTMAAFGYDADLAPTRAMSSREVIHRSVDFLKSVSEGMAGMIHATEVAVLEKLRDMPVPDDPGRASAAFFARAQEAIAQDGRASAANHCLRRQQRLDEESRRDVGAWLTDDCGSGLGTVSPDQTSRLGGRFPSGTHRVAAVLRASGSDRGHTRGPR
jgi:carnitine monooxygenase subunit